MGVALATAARGDILPASAPPRKGGLQGYIVVERALCNALQSVGVEAVAPTGTVSASRVRAPAMPGSNGRSPEQSCLAIEFTCVLSDNYELEDIRHRNCFHISISAPLLSIIQKTPVCVETGHYSEKMDKLRH
jgi:hypothetical protein